MPSFWHDVKVAIGPGTWDSHWGVKVGLLLDPPQIYKRDTTCFKKNYFMCVKDIWLAFV